MLQAEVDLEMSFTPLKDWKCYPLEEKPSSPLQPEKTEAQETTSNNNMHVRQGFFCLDSQSCCSIGKQSKAHDKSTYLTAVTPAAQTAQ